MTPDKTKVPSLRTTTEERAELVRLTDSSFSRKSKQSTRDLCLDVEDLLAALAAPEPAAPNHPETPDSSTSPPSDGLLLAALRHWEERAALHPRDWESLRALIAAAEARQAPEPAGSLKERVIDCIRRWAEIPRTKARPPLVNLVAAEFDRTAADVGAK